MKSVDGVIGGHVQAQVRTIFHLKPEEVVLENQTKFATIINFCDLVIFYINHVLRKTMYQPKMCFGDVSFKHFIQYTYPGIIVVFHKNIYICIIALRMHHQSFGTSFIFV